MIIWIGDSVVGLFLFMGEVCWKIFFVFINMLIGIVMFVVFGDNVFLILFYDGVMMFKLG